MYLQAEQKIFCFGEIAYKLGLLIMATAIFYTLSMPLGNASETINVIKGYIQENTILKEHSNALFLREKWMKEIKEKYPQYKINEISQGVIYVGMVKYINSRRVKVNVAEINREINSNIEVIPMNASVKMHSRASINKIIKDKQALVAINGTYFKPNTGTPLGTLVINNEIISGPIYKRAAFGITKTGYKTERLGFFGSIIKGEKKISIDNINQPRMLFSNVLIYTNKWGVKSPITKPGSKHISIKNGKVIAESDNSLIIPNGGYVISGPKDKLEEIKTGDKVEINYSLTPNWEDAQHIISGGPYLMKNGEIFIDTVNEKLTSIAGRNPRTAIGYTKDNILIIVTIDGRKEGSSGVTITELAKIMKDLGCYEAINLDGGSSTVMYAGGYTYKGTSSNYPAMVSNALVVRTKV